MTSMASRLQWDPTGGDFHPGNRTGKSLFKKQTTKSINEPTKTKVAEA
jgi:hypothetical protein